MERDDAAIIRASLDAPERFEAIFERHYRTIWRYLDRAGGRECAEELASEVFVTAFVKRDRYDPARGAVRSWLYGIASHQLRDRSRGRSREARAYARAATRAATEGPAIDGPADIAASQSHLGSVREVLQQLSPADRDVIVLAAWEQLTYEEIAQVLGVATGTVRSRLSRARARLRALVGPDGERTPDQTAS